MWLIWTSREFTVECCLTPPLPARVFEGGWRAGSQIGLFTQVFFFCLKTFITIRPRSDVSFGKLHWDWLTGSSCKHSLVVGLGRAIGLLNQKQSLGPLNTWGMHVPSHNILVILSSWWFRFLKPCLSMYNFGSISLYTGPWTVVCVSRTNSISLEGLQGYLFWVISRLNAPVFCAIGQFQHYGCDGTRASKVNIKIYC